MSKIKPSNVYEHANDLHVRAYMVYVKSNVAYVDSACTVKMTTSQLRNAFFKRCIISDGSTYYQPLIYSEAANVGKIEYATVSGTSYVVTSASSTVDPGYVDPSEPEDMVPGTGGDFDFGDIGG